MVDGLSLIKPVPQNCVLNQVIIKRLAPMNFGKRFDDLRVYIKYLSLKPFYFY